MSVIAAYKHDGQPVLIGDTAITRPSGRSVHRKIYRISENFVIGWAGYQIVAKEVISSLWREFKDQKVSRKVIAQYLSKYNPKDFGELHTNFIGWIIEEEPHCFLWNCLYPKQLFEEQSYSEGTGQEYFDKLIKRGWRSGSAVDMKPNEITVQKIINDIALARFEESLYRETWDLTYGAAYDLLLFQEGAFRYVRSIIHIGWDYHWDTSKKTGILELAPVVMKYNCFGEFSIFQEALHGQHYDGKTINYLCRPVYDDMSGMDLSNMPLSLVSDYYTNYFLFRENGKTVFKVLLTIQKINEKGPLYVDERKIPPIIRFDNRELDKIYKRQAG